MQSRQCPIHIGTFKYFVSLSLDYILIKPIIYNCGFYSRKTQRTYQNSTLLNLDTRQYLSNYWSDKGFKGTVVNRVLPRHGNYSDNPFQYIVFIGD